MSAELGVGYVGVSFPFDTGGGYSGYLGNDTRVILSGLDIERTAHFGSGLDSVNVIFLLLLSRYRSKSTNNPYGAIRLHSSGGMRN